MPDRYLGKNIDMAIVSGIFKVPNGTISYLNGKLHNLNGPAIDCVVSALPYKVYAIDGQSLSYDEWMIVK